MSEAVTSHGVPSWELHHRLNRALEFSGVKVGEMGKYLDVSAKTMTNYLSGRTRPRDGLVRAWALRCGVPFSWLAYGEEPAQNGPDGASDLGVSPSACTADVIDLATRRIGHNVTPAVAA